ncbi:MAG TPA: enoyl-CoA hydratase [Stellaceae bacterium]|nr:enoyl-CoA hydratase [Stellaceae bacterium]
MISPTERMIAEIDGPIGWMIFNNPAKLNAMAPDMWAAIPAIIDHYERDPAVRAIVLKGAGEKAFISGADINRFEERRASAEAAASDSDNMRKALDRLEHASKPTIAMIRGYCLGGGLLVALHTDMRIAADTARLGIPAAKLGIAYTLSGVQKVLDLVNPAFAREMLFTARQFSGTEAQGMGLVNRAVPEAELEAFTRSYCATMAENAPLSIAASKSIIAELTKPRTDIDRAKCEALAKRCMESEDFAEGRRAFAEKRKPVFQGK